MIQKIGIIGSGSIASHHIRALNKLGADATCIASRPNSVSSINLARAHKIKNTYNSVRELTNHAKDFEALILCTPASAVPEILQTINNMSLPILIEKPGINFADSLSEFKEWNLYFGYNRRFYKTVDVFKDSIDNQKGFYNFKIVEDYDCLFSKDLLFNTIHENSVHFFDLCSFIFGPYSVGKVEKMYGNFGYIINILNNNNECVGRFFMQFGTPANSTISFENSKISLNLKPLEKIQRANKLVVFEPNQTCSVRKYIPSWHPETEQGEFIEDSELKPGFEMQMSAFLNSQDSVLNGNRLALLADAQFAYKVARQICLKIEEIEN